jgi:hypothetical protein
MLTETTLSALTCFCYSLGAVSVDNESIKPKPKKFWYVTSDLPSSRSSKVLHNRLEKPLRYLLHYKSLLLKTIAGNFTDINLDVSVCCTRSCRIFYSKPLTWRVLFSSTKFGKVGDSLQIRALEAGQLVSCYCYSWGLISYLCIHIGTCLCPANIRSVKLIIRLNLVSRLRIYGAYLHSPYVYMV